MFFPEKPLLVIVGPTAVGKTATAIALAKRLDGEIISADSRYFYRGMDIGTAKPTLEEREGVPHYLIDVTDPQDTWSLALFKSAAEEKIADVQQRGKLPILVGGTGQYVRAVIEGWSIPEQEPDARLREAITGWGEEIGAEALHRRLAVVDPEAARQIDYHNQRRTVRALEVIFNTGRKFSDQRIKATSPYSLFILGLKLERPLLYQRIDTRIEAMLEDGLVEETRALLARGLSPDLPSMSAIGYREVIGYLQGQYDLDEAVRLIKRNTRIFVRRQANWFKESDEQIHWFHAAQTSMDEMAEAIGQASKWLALPGGSHHQEVI
ncbi:MAG: tRNA (adenosine(37)-N6)-dimethylallyltransferase MiaA [Chloroflexi bacterium]|nr:tRNA (adenosine(37)-N6)-dimethylallyltransferase MiaA [Chloroflexota bacterium]